MNNRPPGKWVIDRFEEDWAVLSNVDTLECVNLPISSLPQGTKLGCTMMWQDGKWHDDEVDANDRRKRISERFARIKEANQ